MKREDVTSLVEATDAGREGELIFRLVYHKAGCRKPFERLWISSMEDKAIEEGFRNLRPSSEYDALYEAALCRERADWIVGINATRLFSCLYGQTLNVGRVMTPTLAMLAKRQEEIDTFKSEPFYSVRIRAAGVEAEGRKCKDKTEAENILQAVRNSGKAKVESLQKTEKSEKPPLLYDLTTLQREANRRYGFTAQQTLDYTQSLYEKKLVTYPRTDSRYLTDEMEDSVKVLACQLKEKYGFTGIVYLDAKQVINSNKVSDHHAIIPTENAASADYSKIPLEEQKILGLVTAELLGALGKPCLSEEYHLTLSCAGEKFTSSAKIEDLLHVDHRSIANRKVSNDVERYFSGNIITIGAKSADICAEYDGGKRFNTLTFERDSKGAKDLCKSIEREENTSARPVYIESPKTLDQLYRVSKGSTGVAGYFTEILAPNALGTNIDEQSISAAETPTTATQQVQATDLLDEFKGNITDTVGGSLQFNTTSGLQFMEDGHSRMVDISNLSNGIKSLTLLEYAVECGCLGQGDFLILDEPEINLHPAWQIKYAEQIVRLQTVLNLNVVLTTHTPYFFEAMELYARQYKVTDKCHYYLTDLINGTIQLTDVTANTQPIYEKLAKPLEDLDALREKLDSQDR